MMDPGSNHLIALKPCHERVPLIGKMMQIATTETVRVAKAQVGEIRKNRTLKDAVGMRKTIKPRGGRRDPREVDPRRLAIGKTTSGSDGIEVGDDDRRTTSTTPKILAEILKRGDRYCKKSQKKSRGETKEQKTQNKQTNTTGNCNAMDGRLPRCKPPHQES